MLRTIVLLAAAAATVLGVLGCEGPPSGSGERPESAHANLSIVSGSENKSLEPIIQQFAKHHGVHITVKYEGSVDISRELQKGRSCVYDAVWPANSMWLRLGDTQGVLKHEASIMRSPVVFALKKPVAERLGWIGREIRVKDILEAAEAGKLRFAMTSATQSNSGASAYLGFLYSFAGNPEVLTSDDLHDPQVEDQIRRILGSVHRSSGSSGWLMDLLLERYELFDAMVNYEALVVEANRQLVPRGADPLYAFYPVDGLAIADSPLALVDKGDSDRAELFVKLQEHLLSDEVQQQLLRNGRRTGLVGLTPERVDRGVFNPDWGIDLERVLTPIRIPAEPVIREALTLYQTAFRKPSLTIYVLDFSGSMEGRGERELKDAMRYLLEPDIASQVMLQPSSKDVSIVITFNAEPSALGQVIGNEPAALLDLLSQIERREPGGGTDMYKATAAALGRIEQYAQETENYHVAIILMSDGKSQGDKADYSAAVNRYAIARYTPIYTILFGDASEDQMAWISAQSSGRMFDGRKDLIKAFRDAKGYN